MQVSDQREAQSENQGKLHPDEINEQSQVPGPGGNAAYRHRTKYDQHEDQPASNGLGLFGGSAEWHRSFHQDRQKSNEGQEQHAWENQQGQAAR